MTAVALIVAIATGMFGLWFGFTIGTLWATWNAHRAGVDA